MNLDDVQPNQVKVQKPLEQQPEEAVEPEEEESKGEDHEAVEQQEEEEATEQNEATEQEEAAEQEEDEEQPAEESESENAHQQESVFDQNFHQQHYLVENTLKDIEIQYNMLNKITLSYLTETLQIHQHFENIRNYLLFQAGDIMNYLAIQIFQLKENQKTHLHTLLSSSFQLYHLSLPSNLLLKATT